MKIRHYRCPEEAEVCKAFLAWQGRDAEIIEDAKVLKETNGYPGVIIEDNGKFVATGMRDLATNWRYYC